MVKLLKIIYILIIFFPFGIAEGNISASLKNDSIWTSGKHTASKTETDYSENTHKTIDNYIDSLLTNYTFSNEELKQLAYFKEIEQLNADNLYKYIDSILDLDSIPFLLLSTMDYYMSLFREKPFSSNINCENPDIHEASNLYPASSLYNNIWCPINPNPYSNELIVNDTLIELILINSGSDFHMPSEAPVTSRFGWRNGRLHQGVDLAVNHSLPVHCVFPGVVRFSRNYGGYGRLVIVRHHNGLETFYAHLSRIRVKVGQEVDAGTILGLAGNSGRSNGTHLHFEMRYKGVPLNPAHLISFSNNELINDKILLKKIKNNFFVYNENAILYTVQKGDYLHKIASEYGTTVSNICMVNDISRNAILRVGQIIRITL